MEEGFSGKRPRVYFDNSATTRVDPRVMEKMLPYFTDRFGNPSSLHQHGTEAGEAVEKARAQVARAIGARESEIVFTAGGTESDNLAIIGYAMANRHLGDHIVTSGIEHPAVLRTCRYLEELGFRVSYLPVGRDGLISTESLQESLRDGTILISVMAANNEVGTIQPLREIGRIAGERGISFHSDTVQSVTKVPLDVRADGIDMASLSSHKFHGPKGVGALYVRGGIELTPIVHGGGQEGGLRSSTHNVPGIVGMGEALELGISEMDFSVERMRAMRDLIIEGVLSSIGETFLNGHRTNRLCNNANLGFRGLSGGSLLMHLDFRGISVSTGSACSSTDFEPSHVLMAMGLSREDADSSIRISLSRMNEIGEARYLLDILPELVEQLRTLRQYE